MADTGVDIDLYADMESEFPTEDYSTGGANDSLNKSGDDDGNNGEAGKGASSSDLYDDVLTNIKDDKTSSSSSLMDKSSRETSSHPPRRYQVYVGNLTWWTTDADINDAVLSLGVNDFVEVKFYENRANGQSKGFCCVSLGSDSSMRTLMEKLPKKELHGQTPIVTYATKQALNQFEAQSKTRPTPPPPGGTSYAPRGPGGPGSYRSQRPPVSSYTSGRPPLIATPPDPLRGPPPTHGIPPPMRMPPPPAMGAPPPMLTGPPPPSRHLPLPPHTSAAPAPGAHLNPAFFPHGGGVPGYPPPGAAHHGLSEVEFEEIMARNRTVSSSAIARAVQDAASNDFASAIETLVTAISLIKQSKVAHDDRCRILITSLQDTLHGIESKSYGRRERSRSRERRHMSSSGSRRRSYSPREREYHRDYHREHRDYHHRERERSRSRERDYRSSRDDKYYEDRYKHRESHRDSESRREPSERASREDLERGSSRGDKERERERSRH